MKKSIYKNPSSEVVILSPHEELLQVSLLAPIISEDEDTEFQPY